MAKKRKSNAIHGLENDGALVEEVVPLRSLVKNHFENLFSNKNGNFMQEVGIEYSQVSVQDHGMLIGTLCEDEVKDAVWSCNGNKSPSLDGLNFKFLKRFWEVLKSDFMAFFHDSNRKMVQGTNSLFIVMIPNKPGVQ